MQFDGSMALDPLEKFVPPELSGQRLDQALARMFPEYSRSRLKSWILQGNVDVDDQQLRPRDPVSGGEQVVLRPQAEVSVTSAPEPLDLEIAYEDDDLLIVNKPAGLVVHPGAGNIRGTLMNGLLHHIPALEELPRAGIVHRLDKDTSGLLLVGKNLTSHTALVRALADRDVSRHYLAVCSGVLTGGGTIDAPIGRHPVDRLRMSVQDRGKPAVTHFRVKERFRGHTYISVQLDTGRTHQIRVHFAHRRNPLVGDPVYGGRLGLPAGATDALKDALRRFRRQALHATRLSLAHPVSGESLEVDAPPPQDLAALLDVLRTDAATAE
jgi:23S rRNA pseudouridine1911/1915/1917 synthase